MLTISQNELQRLFLSPLAWIILALSQLLLAYLFLTHMDYFNALQGKMSAIPGAPGVTELIAMPLLSNTGMICLLITPLLTMRTIAEERRNENLPLLISAPISIYKIVIGKFIGTLSFFLCLIVMTLLMVMSITLGSSLDWLQVLSGTLGLVLLVASFSVIGIYLSSLFKQPTVAAISSFALLFLLWIIDWASTNAAEFTLLSWLSLLRHFQPMVQGQMNSQDVAYFLIIIFAFLLLTIRRLDRERLD
ncbi:hypothetical protein LCGC14_1876860 [marine sediment metagenome]